jgi:hypothetical protein
VERHEEVPRRPIVDVPEARDDSRDTCGDEGPREIEHAFAASDATRARPARREDNELRAIEPLRRDFVREQAAGRLIGS